MFLKVLILILAVGAGLLLTHWLLRQLRSKKIRYTIYLLVSILIVLVLTNRLHWLSILIAAPLLLIKKFAFLVRFLPLFAQIWRAKKYSGQAHKKSAANRGIGHAEALEILGLKHGATRAEIIEAHKRMMQKMHPDRGGSAHMAKQINQARDRLLQDLE